MIKIKDILEATDGKLHPDALHVSPVKVDGKTKYHVKAVGKNLADGIKVGEHLTDTHLDDAAEMGAKIKHIKEEAEQIIELKKTTLGSYIKKASDSRDSNRATSAYSTGPEYDKQIKTISKRAAGVSNAVDRLTKEDVEPEADMNILVQLRKPIDILEHGTQGGADITFGNGQKVFVEGAVAQKLVESMEKIKPEDRAKVAEFLYQSHDNLMAVYSRLK